LHKQLHAADILFEKSLYDQCRRVLRSAEKLAEKHELPSILMLIAYKKKRLWETMGSLNVSDEEIIDVFEKDLSYTQSIGVYNQLWSVKSKLFSRLSKKGVARSDAEMRAYQDLCKTILSGFSLTDISFESLHLYHHVLSAYYYAIGDLSSSLKHLEVNLAGIEKEDLAKRVEANKYVSALTNAIYITDKIGEHRKSVEYLAQLKMFAASTKSNEDLSIKLFSSISSIELSISLRKGDFNSALKTAHNVSNKLDEYGDKIVPIRRAFLEYKMAVVNMGVGDYSAALKWVNRILNDPNLDKTEDIIGFTQLLDLLVHLELDHTQLLPYSFKNTQRFFKTRNRLYGFEKVLLQSISKLIKCNDPFDSQNIWETLYKELALITNDDVFESVALDYFDFQSWAESKQKRKSFDLIVREKYQRNMRVAS
jgi:PIN domain nuclease of toxin-antitoxin system